MSRKSAIAVLLALALVVVGAAAGATASTRTVVDLHKAGSLGKVLANQKGFTLYLYTPDPKGKSVCNAGCDTTWPPLLTKGKPKAGMGVKQSLLGTTKRSNGKLQVTYKGHPLYRYTGDAKAGQAKGEGYGGIWYAVKATGKRAAASAPPTTTGGGYPPPPGY